MGTPTEDYRVLITEPLASEAVAWLSEHAEVIHGRSDDRGFDAQLSIADALIVRTYTNVNERLLTKAPRLRVVGRAGVGFDNIDLNACQARNIPVVYTPDANTEAVVAYVYASILNHFRPVTSLTSSRSLNDWQTLRNANVAQREPNELTLGILGLGRIGKRVAEIAHAFRMPAIYHDLFDIPQDNRAGAEPVSLDDLLARSDVLTIHIDGRASNHHFVAQNEFASMKHHVLFINSSRGAVVHTESAARFFSEHEKAFGLFDVHHPEPIPGDYPLLNLPNVKLTPHIAGRTRRSLRRMSEVVHDVYAVLCGNQPENPAVPIE